MSYKPVQQKVDGRNALNVDFADTWKQAVLGDRRAQKILLQRISHNGERASR